MRARTIIRTCPNCWHAFILVYEPFLSYIGVMDWRHSIDEHMFICSVISIVKKDNEWQLLIDSQERNNE